MPQLPDTPLEVREHKVCVRHGAVTTRHLGSIANVTPRVAWITTNRIEGERNEHLTNVPTCVDSNSHHRFGAPEALLSAPRPDAASRLSVSRMESRHGCDRLCECRPGSRRSSHSRAPRYLCHSFRSEEGRTPRIRVRRRWNLCDTAGRHAATSGRNG